MKVVFLDVDGVIAPFRRTGVIEDNLVKTRASEGISPEDIEKAIKILNSNKVKKR